MHIRMTNHFIGGCGDVVTGSKYVILNPGELANNVLLFDKFVLQSCKLTEFPQMVEIFGFSAVLELIRSKWFSVECTPNLLAIWHTAKESIRANKWLTYQFGLRQG